MPLSIKSKIEPPLQVSKWLKCPLLVDEKEMEALLRAIEPFEIFIASGLMLIGEGLVKQEEFLDCYTNYIDALKNGRIPDDARMARYFSSVFTRTRDALYAVHVDESRQMIKVDRPVVQLQTHRFIYGADRKFRSMVHGQGSIHWGIQFSYPQLYQDKEMRVWDVREGDEFPNTALFKALQRWMRENTVATPFIADGQRVNVPIRLGKRCFAWINHHCQLMASGLSVLSSSREDR